ncbi:MAG: hypothetical protein GC150_03310 [Rhizobiales bacterium]|nr:hypothetical protein [Hyphomicrobiales bacterium]
MAETANDGSLPDPDEAIPGSVLTHRHVRMLKIAIAIMTLLLVVGFAVLIGKVATMATGDTKEQEIRSAGRVEVADPALAAAIQARLTAFAGENGAAFAEAPMAPGARVETSNLDGKTLVLTLSDAAGITVYRIELESWRVTGVLRLFADDNARRP